MSIVTFEKASPAEVQEILRVFQDGRACMTFLPPHMHTPEEDVNYFTKVVNEEEVILAKLEGEIVGFIALKNELVDHLFVASKFQRQGIGKQLMAKAKELRPDGIKLWVFEDNKAAQSFYEKNGFKLLLKRNVDEAVNEEHLPDRLYEWKPAK